MYTDIKTILSDAAEKNYAVIATSAINMETARGIITAAAEKNAPVIFLLGQNMMRVHAKAELMIPMIRRLAEYANVPVATCLDHGNDPERLMYAFRNGFSSIMYDGSLLPLEGNIRETRHWAETCHTFGMGIEGELGHVGNAAAGDDANEAAYTNASDAAMFARETGVDCLAVAVGTAHGEYPKGLIPHINFDRIRECKEATGGMPLALHGGSGAGDENIVRAVQAGINKINVVTDVFSACRASLLEDLSANPKIGYIDLMSRMEMAAKHFISHWIDLSGSEGKASGFREKNRIYLLSKKESVGDSE